MLRAIFHSALIGRRFGLGAGAGVGDQRIKIRWCDMGRGYASLFLGVVDQRIKIRWYNMGRGYASLFLGGISNLLNGKVARLKTTATGLSQIASDDIKDKATHIWVITSSSAGIFYRLPANRQ
jgi:hypothetical protein